LSSQFALGGFFAATRNFFTGVLSPGVGKQSSTAKFYSAAPLPRPSYTLWLFAGVDGTVRLLDGVTEQTARLNWGSDLASVKTSCGSGWQVLATRPGDNSGDSVRAFEFPDREPIAVSPALDFSGGVTALWTEAKGGSAPEKTADTAARRLVHPSASVRAASPEPQRTEAVVADHPGPPAVAPTARAHGTGLRPV